MVIGIIRRHFVALETEARAGVRLRGGRGLRSRGQGRDGRFGAHLGWGRQVPHKKHGERAIALRRSRSGHTRACER